MIGRSKEKEDYSAVLLDATETKYFLSATDRKEKKNVFKVPDVIRTEISFAMVKRKKDMKENIVRSWHTKK
jgi:hypothetical protein